MWPTGLPGAVEVLRCRAIVVGPHRSWRFGGLTSSTAAGLRCGAALRERPEFLLYYCIGAASAALSGNLTSAAHIAQRIAHLKPGLTLQEATTLMPIRRDIDQQALTQGLRLAGLKDAGRNA